MLSYWCEGPRCHALVWMGLQATEIIVKAQLHKTLTCCNTMTSRRRLRPILHVPMTGMLPCHDLHATLPRRTRPIPGAPRPTSKVAITSIQQSRRRMRPFFEVPMACMHCCHDVRPTMARRCMRPLLDVPMACMLCCHGIRPTLARRYMRPIPDATTPRPTFNVETISI